MVNCVYLLALQVPVQAVVDAASAISATTPQYLATFGPTVDFRSIVTSDLRRSMAHRRDDTAPVFANVSLLVGFADGEASQLQEPAGLDEAARSFVQNVYWRHRQTIVDVIVHQVAGDAFFSRNFI